MENFKITEKLSDGTQTELRISDVIGRLLHRAELIYGKDEDVTYKVEMVGDEPWIVKHTYIPYEGDDVIQLVRVNDLQRITAMN